MKYLIAILLVFAPFCVQAGTIDPTVPDSKYVEYGEKYGCVLPLAGILGDKLNTQFKASCVVISEYYILTAAHVVADSISQHVIHKGKAYPCAIVAVHIDYNSKVMGKNDIAIARLQIPLKLDFYPELYTKQDEKGKICGLAGYGYHGDFNSGYSINTFDNKRRAGSNIIDAINDNCLTYSVHTEPQTSLEFLISPGDSGGGLFIDKKIAGINSYVYATDGRSDSDFGDTGCSTRISDYVEWIIKTQAIIEEILKNEKS
jgi:hypothetical protein